MNMLVTNQKQVYQNQIRCHRLVTITGIQLHNPVYFKNNKLDRLEYNNKIKMFIREAKDCCVDSYTVCYF